MFTNILLFLAGLYFMATFRDLVDRVAQIQAKVEALNPTNQQAQVDDLAARLDTLNAAVDAAAARVNPPTP